MKDAQAQRPSDNRTGETSVPPALEAQAARVLARPAVASETPGSDDREGGGIAKVAAAEVSTFASHEHQYIREYISLADQKAGFVFAAASAFLVYLYQANFHLRWLKAVATWSAADLLALVAMVTLFAGLIAAAAVIVPRLWKTHRGYVFFLSVAEYESATEYASAIASEAGESLNMAVLKHVYDLARVCRRKYRTLAVALWSTAIGFALSIALLLLAR